MELWHQPSLPIPVGVCYITWTVNICFDQTTWPKLVVLVHRLVLLSWTSLCSMLKHAFHCSCVIMVVFQGEVYWGTVWDPAGLHNPQAATQDLSGSPVPDQASVPPPTHPQHRPSQVTDCLWWEFLRRNSPIKVCRVNSNLWRGFSGQ